MPDSLEITLEPGFVRAVSAPAVYSSYNPEYFTRVLDAARDAGVSKILYDFRRIKGHLSTMERFDYATRIAEQFRGFKVAFVVNQALQDANLFGETVANNRGGDIKVSTTLAQAYEWLNVAPAGK